MFYLIALFSAVALGFCPVLKKNYVNNTKDIKTSGDIYLFVNILAATIYFYILALGKVPLNMPTFVFSVVYALIGVFSVLVGLVAYNYAPVVYITVISGALGTILPFLYELLFTDIVFSTNKIISVFLRVAAIGVTLLFSKDKKITAKGMLICVVFGVIGGAAGITTRMYARFLGVLSDGSFFFWTNVCTLPMIFINLFRKGKFSDIVKDFKSIKGYNYAYALGTMLVSNAVTFISIEIMRHISGTVYSVISGSVNLLIAAFISIVIYKENVSKQTIVGVMLSIGAVVLSLM